MHLGNRPPDAAWPLLLLLFLLVRADILPRRIDPLPQSREVFTCLLCPPRSRGGLGPSDQPFHPKAGEVLAYLAPRLAPPPKQERVWAGMPPRPPILPAPELDDLLPPTVNELKLNNMSTGWTTSVRASGPPETVTLFLLRLRLPASSHAFSSSSRSFSLRWTIFLSASCPIISTQ